MIRRQGWIAAAGALVGLTTLAGAAEAQSTEKGAEKIIATDSLLQGATVILRVDGMSCPFCAFGLEKRLKEIAAIDTLVIRVGDGLVLIRPTEKLEVTDNELREAVDRAGFSLREIKRIEHLPR